MGPLERSVALLTPGRQPVGRVGLWLVELWVTDLSCVNCHICGLSLRQLQEITNTPQNASGARLALCAGDAGLAPPPQRQQSSEGGLVLRLPPNTCHRAGPKHPFKGRSFLIPPEGREDTVTCPRSRGRNVPDRVGSSQSDPIHLSSHSNSEVQRVPRFLVTVAHMRMAGGIGNTLPDLLSSLHLFLAGVSGIRGAVV